MGAVVNIITGIFVENALQSSQKDKDAVIQEEMRNKESYVAAIWRMFQELDSDKSGLIGVDQLTIAVENPKVVAYFNALGLEITDVETLFVLLDRDHTERIDMEEFVVGCMRLKGEARSLDLA